MITEFVASNDTGLQDEDGDSSDWIELFNAGDTALDLVGWHLTDNSSDLDQWAFPSVSLDPGAFLVVFASSKDRAVAGSELHTGFKLGAGGEYLALVEPDGTTVAHEYAPQYPDQQTDVAYGLAMTASSQTLVDDTTDVRYIVPTNGSLGTTWTENSFNDAGWSGGPGTTAGLGYENNPGAGTSFTAFIETALPSGTISAYTRFEFNVADPSAVDALTLGMMYDDGFVAYLNGERVAADMEPALVLWNTPATGGRGDGIVIEDFVEFDLADYLDGLVAGTNVLAIHALNTTTSSDMLMIPRLIAGTAEVVTPHEAGFLNAPTPGQPNGSTFQGFVGDTAFSVDRGFFTSAFSVAITTDTPGADIYFTTDGSAPSATNGTLYAGAVSITTTTVLRAVATMPGFSSSNIDTQSYFFLEEVLLQDGAGLPTPPNSTSSWDYVMDPDIVNDPRYSGALVDDLMSLPTLSLVMDAQDAWGPNGFYANPRQSGIAWERPVSVELIDTDGTGLFQQDAGIRIMGSGSTNRTVGKKSMRLVFRDEYGESKLLYPFFGAEHTDEINSIAIRGNYFDTWTFQSDSGGLGGACCGRSRSSYLRDQFAHETQEAMGGLAIGGDWVHLYINGQYWGLYNPTERPDDEFMQSYFGGSDADYDVIKTGVELVDGDLAGWNAMMQIALGNGLNGSLSNNAAYNDLQQYLDMEQFADYLLLNFWGGNHDWPHNNWYAVRDRADNGQFSFISWDAENFLFSVNSNRTGVNTVNSPGILYDRLRQNDEFNLLFADRIHEHMFNGGALSTAANTARFENIVDTIRPALNAEAARWGDELVPNDPYNVIDHYDPFVDEKLNNYFPQRNGIVLSQVRSAGLYPSTSFDAPSFSQHGGVLPTGLLSISNAESTGTIYYTLDGTDPRLPGGGLSASAIAYTSTFTLPDHATVTARLQRSGTWSAKIQADFVLADAPADTGNLRVTEVHYNPQGPSGSELAAGFADGDLFEFVEFLNTSNDTISLDGVELKRSVVGRALDGITFEFGLVALAPGERIVVVSDHAAFTERYGTGINIAGQYTGNLANSGETLHVVDAMGGTIQQFAYDDDAAANWPTSPDGDGPSLVVLDTEGDYDGGSNWTASNTTHGTPGTNESAGLVGDINADGYVGIEDLDQLLAYWGDAAGSSPEANAADLDNSGAVGSGDLSIVMASFGSGSAPATPTSNGQVADDPDVSTQDTNADGPISTDDTDTDAVVGVDSFGDTGGTAGPAVVPGPNEIEPVEPGDAVEAGTPGTVEVPTAPESTEPEMALGMADDPQFPDAPDSVRTPDDSASTSDPVSRPDRGGLTDLRMQHAASNRSADALALARPQRAITTNAEDNPSSSRSIPPKRFNALTMREKK